MAEVFQPSDHVGAMLFNHSERSVSVLYWGPQGWMWCSGWVLTRAEQRGRITSLDLLATTDVAF